MSVSILIPLLCIVALMCSGMPVWIAMFLGVAPWFAELNSIGFTVATEVQRFIATTESASYLAIPFFVTGGAIMNYAGLSKRMLDFADALVGHISGGLGLVNVLVSVFMGGCSGSAAADAAVDCKMLVPEMEKKGYDIDFSAAVTIASSLITPIIPPGMGLVVYATLAGVSIGRIFAAGYLPGFLTAAVMCVLVYVISKKRGYKGSREKMASLKEILILGLKGIGALFIPFGLLGALRAGMFTANECGAILCIYALICGVCYRELKLEHLWPIIMESVTGTATVMITICSANAMTYWLSVERIPNMLATSIAESGLPQAGFLLVSVVVLLIMGMFMTSGVTILTPILAPIAAAMGIDLVHFGIVLVYTWGIGNMTPPFGVVLYQVCGLLHRPFEKVVKATIPFIIMMIAMAVLIAFVPGISTWIPELLYG